MTAYTVGSLQIYNNNQCSNVDGVCLLVLYLSQMQLLVHHHHHQLRSQSLTLPLLH